MSDKVIDEDALRRDVEMGIAFVQRSGLKVLEARRGSVKLLMPYRGNENHIGTMYAGALFTLAEVPGGVLYLTSFDTSKFFPVVKELNIQFRRPVTSDVTVEVGLSEEAVTAIEVQAEANGKAEFVLEAELKTEEGTTVAISRGVYQLRSIG
jgi:thioesterase domain-containing protein